VIIACVQITMATCIGSLATISREPRQARKGATVVVKLCAGVWLVWVASSNYYSQLLYNPGN